MRTLKVLFVLLALAAIAVPVDAQTFIGTGRYSYDDSTDGDSSDNMFRVGNASASMPNGAATYVGGNFSMGSSANGVQIGQGTTNSLTLQIVRGWGSLIMLDGNLNLSVSGQSTFIGRSNGTAYLTQLNGVLTLGTSGKEIMFGAPSTSGGFPKITEGVSDSTVELRGGTMILKGTPRFGAYNAWATPVVSGFPTDPTAMNVGKITITGGTYDNSVASGGENTFIGFTGGDGTVEVLNSSVAKFATLYMGCSDVRTYTLTSQGNTVIDTVERSSNAVLKIGKDATAVVDGSFVMFESNKNVELKIQIASLTDFSQITAGSIGIGNQYNLDGLDPVLSVELVEGFVPNLGDEWAIGVATTGLVTFDGGFRAINAPALPDPSWSYETRISEDGKQLILAVVPEPATLALLGLGGLALIRRRR